jgi:5-formyltetrahydrofolate cyclo-ligase
MVRVQIEAQRRAAPAGSAGESRLMTLPARQHKADLRSQLKARLAALTPDEVRTKSAAICSRLAGKLAAAKCVAGFLSFGSEVRTHELIRSLLADGKHVCVPSFDPVGQRYVCTELKHFHADLAEGKMGILEPKPQAIRPVHTDLPDLWLVPGLAFDARGNRLGRGMGYFDRLLLGVRGVKIALAYDFQVVKEVPAELHDVCVDFIVTETRIIIKRTDQ